jgi:hypothetical protein
MMKGPPIGHRLNFVSGVPIEQVIIINHRILEVKGSRNPMISFNIDLET